MNSFMVFIIVTIVMAVACLYLPILIVKYFY
jgi:hypothetical protein